MRKILTRLFVALAVLLLWMGAQGAEAATQYTQNIIPPMTSSNGPSGIATSSTYKGVGDPWKAFDGKTTYLSDGSTAWGTEASTGWLAYEFDSPKTVAKYVLGVGTNSDSALTSQPNTWTFEGLNQDGTWTVLDSRAGVKWVKYEVKEFTFENTTPYKKYRINITKNNGSSYYWYNLIVTELQMMEVATAAPAAPVLSGSAESAITHLSWNAVTDATSYNVQRSTTPGGPYTTIASGVTATNFDDPTVANDVTYYYTVIAVNMAGTSGVSNELALTPTYSNLNLILNPSFEQYTGTNGVADLWKSYVSTGSTAEYSIVTTPVSDGGNSERIFASGLELNQAVEVYQRFNAQPNKPFKLSGDFNIENLSNAKVQLWVDYYKSATGWDFSDNRKFDYTEVTNGGFVTLNINDTVPSDVVSVQVYAILKGTGTAGTGLMYVDNMKFIQ